MENKWINKSQEKKRIHLSMQEMQEMWVWSLGWEDPLEKERATHSSVLAWRIPQTEQPGGLQAMGSQRAGHNRVCTADAWPWARQWLWHQLHLLWSKLWSTARRCSCSGSIGTLLTGRSPVTLGCLLRVCLQFRHLWQTEAPSLLVDRSLETELEIPEGERFSPFFFYQREVFPEFRVLY